MPLFDLRWVFALCLLLPSSLLGDTALNRELHWLDGNRKVSPGTTWGVPWRQGALPNGTSLALFGQDGKPIPMQTWPLGYWPDGSLKWTAHALPATSDLVGTFVLKPGGKTDPSIPLVVTENEKSITVNTGVIQCCVAKTGGTVIDSITREGKTLARDGKLVCRLSSTPELDGDGAIQHESFAGNITSVNVEQKGPVRAVIKIEGRHASSRRAWLPFVVRLYFYSGGDSIRMVHTIVFDGDQNHEFISGLGIRFSVPLKDELYDRHIRFAGDEIGVWGEAVRGLTGLQTDPGLSVRQAQVAGIKTPPLDRWNEVVRTHLNYIPAYNDFTLDQLSSDAYEIHKRTKTGFTWLNCATGHRAGGLACVGGASGGIALGIRNFWQSYPGQLDIRNAASDQAEVTAWLWSPKAAPMDMRGYHDDMGMDTFEKQNEGAKMTYEDYEPGFATATGVARTSELMIWALPTTPSNEQFSQLTTELQAPSLLVCRPRDYKNAEVFGGSIWNLPDRTTPVSSLIEDKLDFLIDYYKKQIDERHWYGFWYYGNIMHRYDPDRHVWRYDIGGYAWDNSEQGTDLWLWYSFLRTGRADIFHLAEAMVRHTGEVDVYHLGRFKGLGSRHNVVPWGDSSKQLRVSTAENLRFMYFLTADERMGDLMREELDADRIAGTVPVERKVAKDLADATGKPYPMNFLSGIEWTSVASAWLTEWERTGNKKYRDKIVTGMKSIAALPHGWMSAGGGYDPATGQFFKRDDKFYMSPLSASFGGFEVNAELLQLLKVPEFEKSWLDYCAYYNTSLEEKRMVFGSNFPEEYGKLNLTQAHSRLTAYAAWKTHNSVLADRAWKEFLGGTGAGIKVLPEPFFLHKFMGSTGPVNEFEVTTNAAVGFGLSGMGCLALVPKNLPAKISP